jgi:glycosyltransferase involved in cell wall biosynthesis
MIRVTALTSGRNAPASRFRIRQFIKPLQSWGIEVAEHLPSFESRLTWRVPLIGLVARIPGVIASRSGDITWVERSLVVGRHTLESFTGEKRVLDVDDAIWLLSDAPFSEQIASSCEAVVAGNDFLANHYREAGARVFVVPTSVDTEWWRPGSKTIDSKWTVGWMGTSSNLIYLYDIERPLARFLTDFPASELLIVSDKRPRFDSSIVAERTRFVKWRPDREIEMAQSMRVGLMPLSDSQWTRGKCALKMLIYMAVGCPVIASPIGVSREIFLQGAIGWPAITEGDWYEALRQAFLDPSLASTFGANGRRVVEDKYSVQRNVPVLAEIFSTVLNG